MSSILDNLNYAFAICIFVFACIVELVEADVLAHSFAMLSSLVIVSIILLQFLPMTSTRIIVATFWWYVGMSAVDWWIHKNWMHNDSNLSALRMAHKIHHLEGKGLIVEKTGESIYFSHKEAIEMGVMTLPIALLCASGVGLSRSIIFKVSITHILATNVAIGMHNTAHSMYHGYEPPMFCDALSVFLPMCVLRMLHRHHKIHHRDPMKNLCVIFLGFDLIAGTMELVNNRTPSSRC